MAVPETQVLISPPSQHPAAVSSNSESEAIGGHLPVDKYSMSSSQHSGATSAPMGPNLGMNSSQLIGGSLVAGLVLVIRESL